MSALDAQLEIVLPKHLGIIPDGNRRWAKLKGVSKLEAHKIGYENLRNIAIEAFNRGIKYISAFIFSTENWRRDENEVNYLMDLALWVAQKDLDRLNKEDIKVRFIGTKEGLSTKLVNAIENAENKTKNNKKGELLLCFNYGGRQEIIEVCKSIIKNGLPCDRINEDTIEQFLYSQSTPDIDCVVRTSGEKRISNFMLWKSAYAELIFVDEHWPDFSNKKLDEVLTEFSNRKRRFGV